MVHAVKRWLMTLIVVFTVVQPLALLAATSAEFPGRPLYPEVSVIELDDLFRRLDEVIVVDVRSSYEYETLRVKGSVNIPLSSKTFVSRMRKLRMSDTRPIVVYCNGKTCMKSYKAARKCAVNKIDNVHSYDAGIMDWARTYPEHAELLGKSPVNPKKLISKKEFKKHLLSPNAYGEKVASSPAIVLDVRDRFQREALSIYVGRERRAYLDDKKKLDSYIEKAKREGKTLLVHDAAGKQVRWLQYYLKDKGLKSYYFMEGGVAAYYDVLKQEFMKN
jgi:rhodanese-related sulfurtransferase